MVKSPIVIDLAHNLTVELQRTHLVKSPKVIDLVHNLIAEL